MPYKPSLSIQKAKKKYVSIEKKEKRTQKKWKSGVFVLQPTLSLGITAQESWPNSILL